MEAGAEQEAADHPARVQVDDDVHVRPNRAADEVGDPVGDAGDARTNEAADLGGCGMAGGGPVAQLAVPIESPGPDRAIISKRNAMTFSACDNTTGFTVGGGTGNLTTANSTVAALQLGSLSNNGGRIDSNPTDWFYEQRDLNLKKIADGDPIF